jgi:hypothetical protein
MNSLPALSQGHSSVLQTKRNSTNNRSYSVESIESAVSHREINTSLEGWNVGVYIASLTISIVYQSIHGDGNNETTGSDNDNTSSDNDNTSISSTTRKEKKLTELLYLTIEDISGDGTMTAKKFETNVNVESIQIDNCLRNSEYPVVVIAEQNKEKSKNVFSLHLCQNNTDSGEVTYLENVNIYIAPFSVSIDRSLAKQLVRWCDPILGLDAIGNVVDGVVVTTSMGELESIYPNTTIVDADTTAATEEDIYLAALTRKDITV